ncbi:SMI1/KNR4 family protein [bacterium]|nr:SMI1/KNR4 family protein [bacterium]
MSQGRSERMQILASKMLILSQEDEDYQLFGASHHRYLTKPCLSTEEIQIVERNYGVHFPVDYVEFLTQMGNGGFGPYYGLYSLQESLEEAAESGCRDFLSTPFELTDRYNRYEQSGKNINLASLVAGSIIIAHHGCGYYDRLVVSGPQAGEVWHDALGSQEEIIPLQLHFFEWYDKWLTESIEKIEKLNSERRSRGAFNFKKILHNWFGG